MSNRKWRIAAYGLILSALLFAFGLTGIVSALHGQQYAPLAIQLPYQFADAETPQPAAAGVYVLAHPPNPQASLQLARNGLTQQQGVGADYTLAGNVVTFATNALPQAGDTLIAWYRY